MKKEDVERPVSAKMAEIIGKSYGHPSGDTIKFSEVADGLLGKTEVGKDLVLEGMKVEFLEEPDDVKLIREVMEEPLDVIRAVVTIFAPGIMQSRLGRKDPGSR